VAFCDFNTYKHDDFERLPRLDDCVVLDNVLSLGSAVDGSCSIGVVEQLRRSPQAAGKLQEERNIAPLYFGIGNRDPMHNP
jgi:hypothetical protein